MLEIVPHVKNQAVDRSEVVHAWIRGLGVGNGGTVCFVLRGNKGSYTFETNLMSEALEVFNWLLAQNQG